MFRHILNYIIFQFGICSGQEVKVRFWGAKVDQIDEMAKSHVVAITSTIVKKFGSKPSFNVTKSIILAIQQASIKKYF
jgi:hypothetical protein